MAFCTQKQHAVAVMVTARNIQDAPLLHTRTAQISVVTFMYVTAVNRGYSVRPTGSSEPSLHVPLPLLALNPTNTLSYGINIFSFLVYT